jgi:polyhydroxyalkanoate synthesis repressor PhaR
MKPKAPPPLIVKKYENRRLYNTLTSQYINQEQVAQLIRDGYDVRVVDAATGDDITRPVLAQIVLEDAKMPDSVFPLDVLRQMVVASGKATQDNALRYMKAMMEMYQNAYRAMPSPMNPFSFLPAMWGQPQRGEESPQASGQPGGDAEAAAAESESKTEARASEVGDLRQRIEELEAALTAQARKGKAKKTKPRRKS